MVSGCQAPVKPFEISTQNPIPATTDSVNELFDTLKIDVVLDVFIDDKTSAIRQRLEERRKKMQLPPAQQQIVDDYFAQLMAVVNAEFSVDRVQGMMLTVIKDSFSEQDIDALTAFYKTRSGREIVARMPTAVRTFLIQQHAYEQNQSKEMDNHGGDDGMPPSFSSSFHPWDNPEYVGFFDSSIGRDIKARCPMAVQRFDAGVQTFTTELMARLRSIASDFTEKLKASGAH